jgi:hypothetical protein
LHFVAQAQYSAAQALKSGAQTLYLVHRHCILVAQALNSVRTHCLWCTGTLLLLYRHRIPVPRPCIWCAGTVFCCTGPVFCCTGIVFSCAGTAFWCTDTVFCTLVAQQLPRLADVVHYSFFSPLSLFPFSLLSLLSSLCFLSLFVACYVSFVFLIIAVLYKVHPFFFFESRFP